MSGSVTVTVNSLPVAQSLTGGGGYCFGGAGTAVGLSSSVAGTTYQLYNGTTAVGSAIAGTGSAISFGLQSTAGTYTAMGTNTSTGCVNTMSGSTVIAVNPLPTAYTVTGGGTYCAGGAGVHIGLSGSSTGVNYQLYNGGTAVGSPVAGTGVVLDFGWQTTGGTYSVIGTNAATGCTNAMLGSTTIAISALPLPTAYAVTGGGNYCAGGSGVHIGLGASAAGMSYQLYLGTSGMGAALPGTGSALDFGLQTMAGSYTVVATNPATGCNNNMTGTANVVVNTLPVLQTVTGGGNYCVGSGGVAVGVGGSEPGVDYQLYNGTAAVGGPTSGTGFALSFGLQTAPGTYSVMAANPGSGCTSAMTGTPVVAVSALPTVYSMTGGGNYCPGSSGVSLGLGGSDIGVNYQLYNGLTMVGGALPGTGAALDFGMTTVTGTYYIVANGGVGCNSNMSGTAAINISSLPGLHTVTGGGAFCAGGTGIDVALDGSDAGVDYQLYNAAMPIGAALPGTGAALDFGMQVADGTYTVIATDAVTNCVSTMTGSAAVVVNAIPTAYSIAGGGNYCSGDIGSNVSLSGADIGTNYQLLINGSPSGSALGGGGTTLDFGPQAMSGTYTVVATNGTGCTNNMTGSVMVGVNPLPADYTVMGGASFCVGGAGGNVSLSGSEAGISYRLYNGTSPVGSAVSGTGSSLDFGIHTVSGIYTITATNTVTGCTRTMSGMAVIMANPLPAVFTVTGGGSYCTAGSGVDVSLAGSEWGVNYQLYRGLAPVGTPRPGTGSVVSFGPQLLAGNYTVVAVNATSGCTMNMAGVVPVVISPLPTSYNVSGGGGYCAGGSGLHVNLANSTPGVSYQLYVGAVATGGAMAGTGSALDFGLQAIGGNYTVIATDTGTGCINYMTGSATVAVNTAPAAYSVIGGGSYCSGGSGVNVGLLNSASGVQYQLYRSSIAVGSPVWGTSGPLNFGPQAAAGSYTVMATNATSGCTNTMTGGASVVINPLPGSYTLTGGGNYCAGGTGVNVGVSNSGAGVNYQLYRSSTVVGSAVPGTGSAINFGLQTTTGSYTVVATNTATGCSVSMPGSLPVGINSLPVVYTVTGGGNYCAGGSGVSVGVSNSNAGINYVLYHGTTPMETKPGTGSSIGFSMQTDTGSYTVVAENAATGCSSLMTGGATVNRNEAVTPEVTVTSGGGNLACAGHLVTFTAMTVNGGGSPVYDWTVNGVPMGTGNTMSYLPANGDVVHVTLTSNALCATPAVTDHSMTMTVNSPEFPSVTITPNPGLEVCQGSVVTFSPVSSFGGSTPLYVWKKNGSVVDTAAAYSYTPLNNDIVECILLSNYRCRLSETASSNALNMKVDAAVAPTVTISSSSGGHIGAGVQEILTATVVNGGASPTYQWLVNGLVVGGATLPVYASRSFSDLDDVTCRVTSGGPCPGMTGSATVTVHVHGVSVKQITAGTSDIRLIPNPNKGAFTVKGTLGTTADEEVTIEVTNMLGQGVYNGKAAVRTGEIEAHIQLANVANGMYILTLHSEGEHKVFHIVIER